jgi:hypothetical protein
MTRKEAWETLHPLWGHKGGPVTWEDLALVAARIRELEARIETLDPQSDTNRSMRKRALQRRARLSGNAPWFR